MMGQKSYTVSENCDFLTAAREHGVGMTKRTNRVDCVHAAAQRPSFEGGDDHEKGDRIGPCPQCLIEQEFDQSIGNVNALFNHHALLI